MNPSKRDRWPNYKPSRHVLVLRDHPFEQPWQGYVVDWKRHSYKWSVLVVFMNESLESSPMLWKWFPIEKLRPRPSNGNPREGLKSTRIAIYADAQCDVSDREKSAEWVDWLIQQSIQLRVVVVLRPSLTRGPPRPIVV